ncbi:ATP-binding protein [Streptomyces sp. Je 1-4]|uniref:ATP-binding protein n=1 Tax=Streptomyces explomaris TaxID=2981351 RepID=UPI003986CE39
MLEPPTPATWRITLPRGATAVPIARAMVRTAMQDLRATADRTTAQLLAAELVTNVLKHTRGADPIELVVELRPAGCRIEVHDDSPRLVEGLGEPLPLAEPDAPLVALAPAGPPPVRTTDGPPAADGHVPMQRAEDTGQQGGHREDADGAAETGETWETGKGGHEGHGEEPDGHEEHGADDELDADGQDGVDGQDDGREGADPDDYTDADANALADDDNSAETSDTSPGADDADAANGIDAPSAAPGRGGSHGGRGLLLIRSLSAASGCRPTPRGKAVWFTLPELRRPRRR